MSDDARTCLVVADFNPGNLCGLMGNDQGTPHLVPLLPPAGQPMQVLLDGAHEAWLERPDFALVWTRPEQMSPTFSRALEFAQPPMERILKDVDDFAHAVTAAAERVHAIFVASWTIPPARRGFGMVDMSPQFGLAALVMRMNLRLAERLDAHPSIFVLDAQRWMSSAGSAAYQPKLWYLGKVPFDNRVFKAAVADVRAAVRGIEGRARKLVLVDLDDTLWGGLVGEEGIERLQLGGHDHVGEAYVDVQRGLKALTSRGILLGIVSKNDESLALEAIRSHPEMVLGLEDFVAWRINWEDKATNILELVEELNIGLESVVFIDDSPGERERVRTALPDVLVLDWPEDPSKRVAELWKLDCFDAPTVSSEDLDRTQRYQVERQRQDLRDSVGSVQDWLKGLDIRVQVEPLSSVNLKRATQLLNKTNQMNLTTRRYTEREFYLWSQQPGNAVWTFRVTDRLGDSGIVGVASLSIRDRTALVQDFLLSCRVFGRCVEDVMLATVIEDARAANCTTLVAEYQPTERNDPARMFLLRSGLDSAVDGVTFSWDCRSPFPFPEDLVVEGTAESRT